MFDGKETEPCFKPFDPKLLINMMGMNKNRNPKN